MIIRWNAGCVRRRCSPATNTGNIFQRSISTTQISIIRMMALICGNKTFFARHVCVQSVFKHLSKEHFDDTDINHQDDGFDLWE